MSVKNPWTHKAANSAAGAKIEQRFLFPRTRRSRAVVAASPKPCSDLRARLLDTMKLLSATTCFVHAHDVWQGRSRRASRRAVCLTPVIDAAEAQKIMSTKAAREVLTTDAMNHLVSFGPCINSCRLPALAPIHSPCPEWSCNTCACTSHLVHVLVAACVMSCAYRLTRSNEGCSQLSVRPTELELRRSHPVQQVHRAFRCLDRLKSSATHSETARSL